MTRRTPARASVLASVAVLLITIIGLRPADAATLPAQEVPGMRALLDLSCRPDGTCLAVGYTYENVGAVVLLRAGGPSGPVRTVPGTVSLSAIACPLGGTCIAVGRSSGGGIAVEVGPDATPGPARPAPGTEKLLAVACPTESTCIAIGRRVDNPQDPAHFHMRSSRFTIISNGQPAASQRFARSAGLEANGIACPTATTCLAVGYSGVFMLTDTGAGWTVTANYFSGSLTTGYPTGPISCASRTLCTAAAHGSLPAGNGGFRGVPAIMTVSVNGTRGPVEIIDQESGMVLDISCVSGRTCTAVGQDSRRGQGLLVDVFRGIPAAPVRVENASSLNGVSCVGVATCGIAGHSTTGARFFWHGPVPG